MIYSLLHDDQEKGAEFLVSWAAMILAGSLPGLPQLFPAPSCCMPKLMEERIRVKLSDGYNMFLFCDEKGEHIFVYCGSLTSDQHIIVLSTFCSEVNTLK